MNNTKQLQYEKIISKNEFKEVLISKWMKPKGYELEMTQLSLMAFGIYTNLIFGKYSEFKKFIKDKHNFDTEHEACMAMVVQVKDKGVTWNYMLIQENEWSAENYGTIAHELHHLTHFVLSDKGVNYGEGGEEVFAYIQGYFMELVVRAFIELKKVTKKKK
ncbi:MAG: hypothetical protein ACP5N7_05855 [Candidatus Pacearchaeota archaeon]